MRSSVVSDPRTAFVDLLSGLLHRVVKDEHAALERAEQVIADALGNGRQVLAFGTGHSHSLALEFCDRAGGLVAPKVLRDSALAMQEGLAKSTAAERLGDYGPMLVDLARLSAGDVLIVISNSGRNAVPVEAAQEAKRRGVITIAVTSLSHSRGSAARAPATARLFEVADIVIDNHSQPGDAAIAIDGLPAAVGATSTVIGATIMQLLSIGVAARMTAAGTIPEIFVSANSDGSTSIQD